MSQTHRLLTVSNINPHKLKNLIQKFNYPLKLGKPKAIYFYGAPTILENDLNIHMGIKYIKFSLKEATGLMGEIGLSYRISLKAIKHYKLKDDIAK